MYRKPLPEKTIMLYSYWHSHKISDRHGNRVALIGTDIFFPPSLTPRLKPRDWGGGGFGLALEQPVPSCPCLLACFHINPVLRHERITHFCFSSGRESGRLVPPHPPPPIQLLAADDGREKNILSCSIDTFIGRLHSLFGTRNPQLAIICDGGTKCKSTRY